MDLGMVLTACITVTGTIICAFIAKDSKKSSKDVVDWFKKRQQRTIIVLVLDDDPYDRAVAEDVLIECGHPYKLFSNEDEYRDEIGKYPNVHVIDHFLTRMNGLQMTTEIKLKHPGNYIIICSGAQDEKLKSDYYDRGARKYISKNEKDFVDILKIAVNEGFFEISNR